MTGAGWDSFVHASFRLGGGFSEKISTAEGVEVIDTVPALHLSLGATQPDAPVHVEGDRSMTSFYRKRVDNVQPNKRPLRQTIAPGLQSSRKKPTIRTSKQQRMEDLLTKFAS